MESGWVYDVKTDLGGKIVWKARFVAKGYSQVYGLESFDVVSPTMHIKSFRTLLVLHGGINTVFSECWNVSGAFLFADMKEEVYIKQPRGHVDLENKDKV